MSDLFRAFEDEWAEAVERRDVGAAADLLESDFALSSVGGVAAHMPREQWLETLPRIETRSLRVRVIETRDYGDVAVVQACLEWQAQLGQRDLSGEYAVTDVLVRVGSRWKASWRVSVRQAGP